MGAKFTMSGNFERDLKKQVQSAVNDVAADYQRIFDDLGRRYKGRPVSQIKPALKRAVEARGGKFTDPELTRYAEHISKGTTIKMKVQ
jgi:hypothetical protein